MKVLVIIGELQKVTDKFDSAVACITDILSKLDDAQDTTVICVELKEYGKYAYNDATCDCLSKNDLCNKLDAVMKHHHCIFCFPEHQ